MIRDRIEECVSELCRVKIEPPILPLLSWARNVEPGRHVLAVRVTAGPDQPYARVHQGRKGYFIRVGSTSREASREELERMYQASGQLDYGGGVLPDERPPVKERSESAGRGRTPRARRPRP